MTFPKPETMLAYASILEKPKYYIHNNRKFLSPNGEIIETAIAVLREMAELHRLAADWHVSSELIGIRVRNCAIAPAMRAKTEGQ